MKNRVYKSLNFICNILRYLFFILVSVGFIGVIMSWIFKYMHKFIFLCNNSFYFGMNLLGIAFCCLILEKMIELFYAFILSDYLKGKDS